MEDQTQVQDEQKEETQEEEIKEEVQDESVEQDSESEDEKKNDPGTPPDVLDGFYKGYDIKWLKEVGSEHSDFPLVAEYEALYGEIK